MKKHAVILFLATTVVLFQNCSKVAFNKNVGDNSVTRCQGTSCIEPSPTPVGPQCFGPIAIQQPPETKKLDILFAIDTSGSLDDERADIANQIGQFVNALSPETDYNIGVILAHHKSNTSGVLWRDNPSHPLVLKKSTHTLAQNTEFLYSRITNQSRSGFYADDGASGGEAGLISLRNLFTTRFDDAKNAGFLRDDAGLAIVILSDENDLCVPFPQRSPISSDTRDANGNRIPDYEDTFYTNNCGGISATSVYGTITSALAGKPFLLSGILHLENSLIPTGANHQDGVGAGYIELIRMAQTQVLINMDTENISTGLARIGDAASTILDLTTEFTIREAITVDPSTVEVRVDDVLLSSSEYTLIGNVIDFSNHAGAAESQIEIRYCGN